ncbi:Protein prenylyltransferase superfamily protein [Euphorbia peplus]|nr:Protein prenylyltransferase superfamily protein [Euphorbia peplus]
MLINRIDTHLRYPNPNEREIKVSSKELLKQLEHILESDSLFDEVGFVIHPYFPL